MRAQKGQGSAARQRGATLVIALLILVLIMMIGITAVSTSNTQYKLAGNLQFEDGAMNNAEAAVSTAENWLATGTNYNNAGFVTYDAANAPHLYPAASTAAMVTAPLTTAWSDSNSAVVGSGSQRYQIQLMSTNNLLTGSSAAVGRQAAAVCNKVNTYQITGRGASSRGATKFVQSFYSVLSCP
ncbi:MAG: pilus assembly PilX family protein [Rhodoferax sp.]